LCSFWYSACSPFGAVLSWFLLFFFSSRRRHTRFSRDWSSDVCSSDLSPCGTAATRRVLATVPQGLRGLPVPDPAWNSRRAHRTDSVAVDGAVADPHPAAAPDRPGGAYRWSAVAPVEVRYADHGRRADSQCHRHQYAALGRSVQPLRLGGAGRHAAVRRD